MACFAFPWLLHPSRPLSDLAAVPVRHRSGRWAGCLWGPVGVGLMGDGIPSSVAQHWPPRRGPPDSGLVGAAVGGRHGGLASPSLRWPSPGLERWVQREDHRIVAKVSATAPRKCGCQPVCTRYEVRRAFFGSNKCAFFLRNIKKCICGVRKSAAVVSNVKIDFDR
mmetsp:Transcript_37496/g.73455  ORF Transcript_37496/g.73455 Transcript_37496/m.73455 type:complete len:166 (-) Transcript_37496:151-648(-)